MNAVFIYSDLVESVRIVSRYQDTCLSAGVMRRTPNQGIVFRGERFVRSFRVCDLNTLTRFLGLTHNKEAQVLLAKPAPLYCHYPLTFFFLSQRAKTLASHTIAVTVTIATDVNHEQSGNVRTSNSLVPHTTNTATSADHVNA